MKNLLVDTETLPRVFEAWNREVQERGFDGDIDDDTYPQRAADFFEELAVDIGVATRWPTPAPETES